MVAPPEAPSAPRPDAARLPGRWGGAALLIAFLAALIFDRWYSVHLDAGSRVAVQRAMGPTASALGTAVARRVAQLNGLHSFVESQPTRERLDATFETFAGGVAGSTAGVRTLQLVQGGVIVAT